MRPLPALFCSLALFAALSVQAEEPRPGATRSGSYWTDKRDGWHFYEPEPPPAPPAPTPEEVSGGSLSTAPAFSNKWLRESLPVLLDRAMDNPSKENVKLVAFSHQVAQDKSSAFQDAWKRAIAENPALNAETRRPLTQVGRSAARENAKHMIATVMARLKEKVGLFYYFSSMCPYCAKQNTPLEAFERLHDFPVLAVSMDGLPMPDGHYQDFLVDQGQSQLMGVNVTPTFIVAVPETGEFIKLAEGIQALPQLEDKLIDLAERRGWITGAEYDAIQGSLRNYLQDHMPKLVTETDPQALLALLEAAGEATLPNGGSTPVASPVTQGPQP